MGEINLTLLTRATISTVLDLPFAQVQWGQAVTLFPMVEASEFVAGETFFSFAPDAGGSIASTPALEDATDAFSDLLNRDCWCPFFFPAGPR